MNRSRYYFPNVEAEYLGPFSGYYLSHLPDGRECRKYMEQRPSWLQRFLSSDNWIDAPNSFLP